MNSINYVKLIDEQLAKYGTQIGGPNYIVSKTQLLFILQNSLRTIFQNTIFKF